MRRWEKKRRTKRSHPQTRQHAPQKDSFQPRMTSEKKEWRRKASKKIAGNKSKQNNSSRRTEKLRFAQLKINKEKTQKEGAQNLKKPKPSSVSRKAKTTASQPKMKSNRRGENTTKKRESTKQRPSIDGWIDLMAEFPSEAKKITSYTPPAVHGCEEETVP